jgi:hypothetical protein
MSLTPKEKAMLKGVYKKWPHPFNENDLVDGPTRSSAGAMYQMNRLSMAQPRRLLDIHELHNAYGIMFDDVLFLEDAGYVRKLPDAHRRHYDDEPTGQPRTVLLVQITQKGIDYLNKKKATWKAIGVWFLTTVLSASTIGLILKLLGWVN